MLQQTRVETVIPYYERWMRRFSTIHTLASASLQDVLIMWEGLGYYGRARNLHKAAQKVMQEFGGRLPGDVRSLRKLPGIGRYTAGAIAAIAFGGDEPMLDGNIRRVLARYFNMDIDARSTEGERHLWQLAAHHLPAGHASEYHQAMMDLGAMICYPKSPQCEQCPLTDTCQARILCIQEQRPVRLPKPGIPHHVVTAAVIRRGDKVLIARRPSQGLLGGLWEFPGGKQQDGEDLPTCLQREINEELGVEIEVVFGMRTPISGSHCMLLVADCCKASLAQSRSRVCAGSARLICRNTRWGRLIAIFRIFWYHLLPYDKPLACRCSSRFSLEYAHLRAGLLPFCH
jgi:A/G-specific adenine glycosylase